MSRKLYYIILLALVDINFTLSRLIYPPFFEDYDIGHFSNSYQRVKRNQSTINGTSAAKTKCSEDKLMTFLAEIQVINPESILKIATIEDLGRMCRQVSENMDKTEKYLATCIPPIQPDLYMQLIKGVQSLHKKLCMDEEFRKRFEKYHKCLKEMYNEFESCNGPADWNEDSEPSTICAAYKETVNCYYVKSAKVCGKEAAATMKELMEAIINSVITVKCNLGSAPAVPDAMPKAYIEKQNNKNKKSTATKQITSSRAEFLLKLILVFMIICL